MRTFVSRKYEIKLEIKKSEKLATGKHNLMYKVISQFKNDLTCHAFKNIEKHRRQI
jgi:hypothetical protein